MATPVEPVTARKYYAVTPSDTALLHPTPSAFRCGEAGDLVLEDEDGAQVTIENVLAGEVIPCRARRVRAATTCDKITAYCY